MPEWVFRSIAQPQFRTILMGIFAVCAMILAGVGIYSTVSYSVSQRTHEIGIRMALGANRREILKLVVAKGLKLTLTSVAVGLTAACALSRIISSLLYGVSTIDPVIFIVAPVLLMGIAFLANYIPARRAMNYEAVIALRYE